jgi:chaperonin GroES
MIRPLYDRLVIKRLEEEPVTRSGILIPETARKKPQQGKVVATGDGRMMENGNVRALLVAKGDRVLFDELAGSEFQFDGEEHLVIREDDVLAILS